MKITRPYNAEDNEYNIAMNNVLEHYTEKIGETITEKEIYTYCVWVKTESGREFQASKADGCRSAYYNVRNFIYLKELIDGKAKRIKKSEW